MRKGLGGGAHLNKRERAGRSGADAIYSFNKKKGGQRAAGARGFFKLLSMGNWRGGHFIRATTPGVRKERLIWIHCNEISSKGKISRLSGWGVQASRKVKTRPTRYHKEEKKS